MEFNYIMFFLMAVMLGVALWRMVKHIPSVLACYYVTLSALLGSFYPEVLNGQFVTKSVPMLYAISGGADRAALYALIMIAGVFSIPIKWFKYSLHVVGIVGVLNVCWIIINHFIKGQEWGIMLTSTLDGTFLAMCVPLVFYAFKGYTRWIMLAVLCLGIFITQSSVGMGGLLVAIMAVLIQTKRLSYRSILVPLGVLTTAYIVNPVLFYNNGRYEAWAFFMKHWWNDYNVWFGSGAGAYHSVSAFYQQYYEYQPENFFSFLHNDWLQGLFEYGIVGMSISILSIFSLLFKHKRTWLMPCIVTFISVCFFNSPLKYPIGSIVGCVLLRWSVTCDS